MKNERGVRLLSSAAANRDSKEVTRLLASGIDPNGRDAAGGTALVAAAMGGCPECVRLLLDAGAGLNIDDGGGWTPLMYAAWRGKTECLSVLLAAGADPGTRDSLGRNAEGVAEAAREWRAVAVLAAERERIEMKMASAIPASSKGARRM
jgi:ankyrin repeat protein